MKNFILFLLLYGSTAVFSYAQNSAAWQQTSGPEGGYVFDLYRTAGTVYAATDNGIWASTDEGQTWSSLGADLQDHRVMAVYAKDAEIMALVIKFSGSNDSEGSFFRSTDSGLTWTKQPVSSTPPYIHLNTYSGEEAVWRDGNRIWIDDEGSLYYSDDDGATWSEIVAPPNVYFSKAAANGDKIWAYSYEGIYTSDDLGATWVTTPQSVYINDLFADGPFLMQLKIDSIFVSTDFGQNWQGNSSDFYTLKGTFRLQDGSFAQVNGYLNTSAAGLNWQVVTQSGAFAAVVDGVESGNAFIAAGSGGIFRTTQNNTQFEKAQKGFIGTRTNAMAAMPNGKLIVSTNYAGIWSSNNKGFTWELAPNPTSAYYAVEFREMTAKGDTIWGVGSNDSLYTLVGNSNTWTKILDADAWFGGETFVRIFGNDVYLVEDAKVRRSKDGGASWQTLALGTISGGIRDIAQLGNFLFYTTNEGEVFRSGDDGANWQKIYQFWSPGAHRYNKLGISGGRLLIWSEYESFYSINNGDSWQNLAMTGLPKDSWGDVYFKPLDLKYYQNIILCTFPYAGVYLSFDQGNTWEPLNNGLTHLRTRRLVTSGTNIFMGASTSGVWQLDADFEVFSGQVYNDLNQNGQKDNGEPPLKNILVSAEPLGSYAASDVTGAFSLVAAASLDSIRLTLPNQHCSVLPAVRLAGSSSTGYDFGIHFTPGIIDLSLDIANWAPFRPGFSNELTLTVSNVGNEAVSDAWVELLPLPANITVLSMSPSGVATIVNDTLRWQVGNLAPFETAVLTVSVKVDVAAIIGDVLSFEGYVHANGDVELANNRATLHATVVGSYDPNDKSAAANITPEDLAIGKPIEYTIRFENTGNFYAETVVVKDVLEANLNPATFRFISSSHPCVWKIKQNGTVEFTFENIYLNPDETGFVRFSLEGDRDLNLNDMVSNTAEIFFDFNAPIVTNTVKTTVQYALSSQNPSDAAFQLKVAPNPARDFIVLSIQEAALSQAIQLQVLDQNGKRVIALGTLRGQMRIDLSALSAGMYDVVLMGQQGKVLGREKVVVVK